MSYSDDNIPYVCSENVNVTIEKLEEIGKIRLEWFFKRFLKGKCWHLSSHFKYEWTLFT